MAGRPVFHPDLGAFFMGLRAEKGWGQSEAADLAQRRGLAALTRQVLLRLEKGKTKWPDPEVLRDLANLYGRQYEELVAEVVRHSYQIQSVGAASPSTPADLVPQSELVNVATDDGGREFVSVPVLAGRIAAGPPLVVDDHDVADHVAFSRAVMGQLGVTKPVCVRVGRYERSMLPTIRPGDTVLLDCSDSKRENPRKGRIYAVNVEEGATLKRVAIVGGVLMLISDNLDKDEYPIRTIECEDDATLRNIIVGEAVWCGTSLL